MSEFMQGFLSCLVMLVAAGGLVFWWAVRNAPVAEDDQELGI